MFDAFDKAGEYLAAGYDERTLRLKRWYGTLEIDAAIGSLSFRQI